MIMEAMAEEIIVKEVIVVEGRADAAAVNRAVNGETIVLSGFGISAQTFARIDKAYLRTGIIILTDPDFAGEKIRARLSEKYPKAKHAFLSKEDATKDGDIGVENASPQNIRYALEKARCEFSDKQDLYGMEDMRNMELTGTPEASFRRDKLGGYLGVGYGNTKTFLKRINHYGITPEELSEGLAEIRRHNGQ